MYIYTLKNEIIYAFNAINLYIWCPHTSKFLAPSLHTIKEKIQEVEDLCTFNKQFFQHTVSNGRWRYNRWWFQIIRTWIFSCYRPKQWKQWILYQIWIAILTMKDKGCMNKWNLLYIAPNKIWTCNKIFYKMCLEWHLQCINKKMQLGCKSIPTLFWTFRFSSNCLKLPAGSCLLAPAVEWTPQ
jgi:hypothetical protein